MIRLFSLVEAASFAVAALIHSGLGMISGVLLIGLVLTWIRPGRRGSLGFAARGLARSRDQEDE